MLKQLKYSMLCTRINVNVYANVRISILNSKKFYSSIYFATKNTCICTQYGFKQCAL